MNFFEHLQRKQTSSSKLSAISRSKMVIQEGLVYLGFLLTGLALATEAWLLSQSGLNESSYLVRHLSMHFSRVFLSVKVESNESPTFIEAQWPVSYFPMPTSQLTIIELTRFIKSLWKICFLVNPLKGNLPANDFARTFKAFAESVTHDDQSYGLKFFRISTYSCPAQMDNWHMLCHFPHSGSKKWKAFIILMKKERNW